MAPVPIWKTFEHKGPYFPPEYEPCPNTVKFYYEGEEFKLSVETEEVASFYAKLNNDFPKNVEIFKKNFFQDWRQVMNDFEKETIQELSKCNFSELAEHFSRLKNTKKVRKEEKRNEKEIAVEYGFCEVDGKKEKVSDFKVPPPGIYIGGGNDPKNGKLIKRMRPEDIIINIGKDAKSNVECFNWKSIVHDQTSFFLAEWTHNVTGKTKHTRLYQWLKFTQKKEKRKFEIARKFWSEIPIIEQKCLIQCKSSKMLEKQVAVATYLIIKFFLPVDNRKFNNTAETVIGCCKLCVKHIELHDEDKSVELKFLRNSPKSSQIVHENIFEALKELRNNMKPAQQIFRDLNTGLIDKQFRKFDPDFNSMVHLISGTSKIYEAKLRELSSDEMTEEELIMAQNQAAEFVSQLQNKKTIVKTHMDPRITVSWCKKWEISLDKVFSNSHITGQFAWAFSENEFFEF